MKATSQDVFDVIEEYIDIKIKAGSNNMPLSCDGITYAELQEAKTKMRKLIRRLMEPETGRRGEG